MKNLIAYGTKYGTTAKCAKLLQAKLTGETVLVNLIEQASPDLAEFDQIIIGGSIYAGQINKQVRKFCDRYLAELTDKKTGIFICSGVEEEWITNLNNSFPKVLIDKSVTGYLGGEINFDQLNFAVRFIVKKLMGDGPQPEILEENIAEFAAKFN